MSKQKRPAEGSARTQKTPQTGPAQRANEPAEDLLLTMIPTDFDVVRIGSYETVTLFGAERKDLFHFVCYEAGSGLRQYHIPHFRIAYAISAAGGRTEETLQYPLADGLSLLTQKSGPLGLLTGEVCFLLNGSAGSSIGDRMIRAAEILNTARKRVVCENGHYAVAGAKTQGGKPVSSRSFLLMDGIGFERSFLRRLSARQFGLYSAFCTHRDFPCALDQKSCLEGMVKAHFEHFDAIPHSEDFLQMIMTVQDKLFPYRIWGKDSKVSVDSAIEALAVVVSKLGRVQRTQWVLLNGMHGGSLFLQLAVISGVITWEDYRQFQTQAYQPDSPEEQSIRSSASYIELFGEFGKAVIKMIPCEECGELKPYDEGKWGRYCCIWVCDSCREEHEPKREDYESDEEYEECKDEEEWSDDDGIVDEDEDEEVDEEEEEN
jgi:hypothetical protein